MNRSLAMLGLSLAVLAASQPPVRADGKSRMAAEAAEYVLKRFGRQAVRESTEVFARKIEAAAARHGNEVFDAVRRVGPRALPLAEEAGSHATQAVKAMARHGEAGAAWIAARPRALNLVARHGDEAAAVLVRHTGGIAEPVIESFGSPAVRALAATGPRGGRRVAMMMADGELAAIGRTPELFEVIAKHGDAAADFVWRNKGALAVGATLTAFLANPQPFLDGAQSVTETVAVQALAPAIEKGTQEVAQRTNWTLVFLAVIAVVAGADTLRWYTKK
jgi:hypothetical protein